MFSYSCSILEKVLSKIKDSNSLQFNFNNHDTLEACLKLNGNNHCIKFDSSKEAFLSLLNHNLNAIMENELDKLNLSNANNTILNFDNGVILISIEIPYLDSATTLNLKIYAYNKSDLINAFNNFYIKHDFSIDEISFAQSFIDDQDEIQFISPGHFKDFLIQSLFGDFSDLEYILSEEIKDREYTLEDFKVLDFKDSILDILKSNSEDIFKSFNSHIDIIKNKNGYEILFFKETICNLKYNIGINVEK